MKKISFLLLICTLIGVGTVVALFLASSKIVHKGNSFLRITQKNVISLSGKMDLNVSSWYLAGINADRFFLGNIQAPFKVLVIQKDLTDSFQITLSVKDKSEPSVHKFSTVKIDSPYFFLADGFEPLIYRGNIGEWIGEIMSLDSNAYFNQFVPIGPNSFAIRANNFVNREFVLGTIKGLSSKILVNQNLLQKQIDGIFCTDGILLYNNDGKLVYVYHYRNQYIVYDTSLNLIYRGQTIDTFSQAQIKIAKIKSDNSTTLLESNRINKQSCVSGNYLFIRSSLLAKNDSETMFDRVAVIDVYNISDHTYQFSFTIPHYNRDLPLRDFMVYDCKILLALHGKYLVKYTLSNKFFKPSS